MSGNKKFNSNDNIRLNFLYNHELGVVFNDISKESFNEIKNMFNKLIKINNRLV